MNPTNIRYRDTPYTIHEQKPNQGDLFYHKILKQVDRVTDITADGKFLTGTELGVCRMANCFFVTQAP